MLIVAAILAMLAAFVLPQVTKIPRRIEVENALSGIRQAISETAMRARTTGTALELRLNMDDASAFSVSPFADELSTIKGWLPPAKRNEEARFASALALEAKESYELSSAIEWLPAETGLDQFEYISFCFFEDGQASGLPLRFNVAGRRFQLEVDKLTGDPLIQEFD